MMMMSLANLLGSSLPFGIKGLIVGLGNPGSDYDDTPHNIGFQVLDAFAKRKGVTFKNVKKANALLAQTVVEGEPFLLVKPTTYMNLSGNAVLPLMRLYDIPAEKLFVVVDEINLNFGTLRLRPKGSSGGQNGMKHIISALGQQQTFPRLRMGIGPQPEGMPLEKYVLTPYSTQHAEELPKMCERAAECIELAFAQGIAIAQNRFNT
jgi:peptidyl-tRNA hydrolase, PTH1 family